VTALTAQDRHQIDLARQLAALGSIAAVREHAGTDDTVVALAQFWGEARVTISGLTAIAERLGDRGQGQAAEDTRRLDRIRALLAGFDWEHDDRQYTLEAIGRIAEGGAR
jgi:hypothetical protein